MASDSDVERLREAIRLTRECVGERMLPALPGWSWFDAIAVTGGFDGFGRCGCVLDPWVHGRSDTDGLLYCKRPVGHAGKHALSGADVPCDPQAAESVGIGPETSLDEAVTPSS